MKYDSGLGRVGIINIFWPDIEHVISIERHPQVADFLAQAQVEVSVKWHRLGFIVL